MIKYWIAFILCNCSLNVYGQVANNKIGNRISLKLDGKTFHSTTAQSSVEWECINKALTNKCLVYHNDQWFDFTPKAPGTYFLNISSQQCRDKQGIQLIVIEGNPCAKQTYKILKCISKVSQGDIFVSLDSLKGGVQYLINIDGFLGDYCEFDIQLATTPTGLPFYLQRPESVKAPVVLKNKYFMLRWHLNANDIESFDRFNVYRSDGKVFPRLIYMPPVRRNALGVAVLDYEMEDSVIENNVYVYQVYGIEKETLLPVPLLEQQVSYFKPVSKDKAPRSVSINLSYPQDAEFELVVFDRQKDKQLFSFNHIYDAATDEEFEIDLGAYVDEGVREFLILVKDDNAKPKEFYYRVDMKSRKFIRE